MTDSAQDYTYEVSSVDSSGQATIRLTSYDSLQHLAFYQLRPGDSDGTIAEFVKERADYAIMKWSEEREAVPSITIGTPVSARYKTLREAGEKPLVNFLTKIVESSESETSDEIITSYSVRDLTPSEKSSVYQNLSASRNAVWLNLLEAGLVDSASTVLGITDYASDSAEIEYRHADEIFYASSSSQGIRTSLGLNDSDFAALFSRD